MRSSLTKVIIDLIIESQQRRNRNRFLFNNPFVENHFTLNVVSPINLAITKISNMFAGLVKVRGGPHVAHGPRLGRPKVDPA